MTQPIISLTRGVPDPQVFPSEELADCMQTALQRDPSVLLQYGRSPGYAPLREWLAEQHGVGADQIFTGNGSLEVYTFITQNMVSPGERVFVESPTYDRAITLLRRVGAEVVGIPLEQDGVNLEVLEAELRKGAPVLMYVIADFQNPMGITTSVEKREALAALAESHRFWIVEDVPYRRLRYWGQEVPSLWSLAPTRVLQMSSFSKMLSPGLRLGYMVGPAEIVASLAAWAVDTYIGPVLPIQGMVNEYCRRGLLAPNIERLKQVYRPRLEATLSALDKYVPQATWTRPEGGFFVSGFLAEGHDVVSLQERAGEAGLGLSDGRGFFPNPDDGIWFLRIPFCSLTPEDIEEAISRLGKLLRE